MRNGELLHQVQQGNVVILWRSVLAPFQRPGLCFFKGTIENHQQNMEDLWGFLGDLW